MSTTSAGCAVPPARPAVADAAMVAVLIPRIGAKNSDTVACCLTTMALALSEPPHEPQVLGKHFNCG